MKFSLPRQVVKLLLSTVLLAACGGNAGNSVNTGHHPSENLSNHAANIARTNVEELGMHIKVPYETEEAVWREDNVKPEAEGVPAGAQKKIVAVLKFSPEDSDKLVDDAMKLKAPEGTQIAGETWFPAELTAQVETSGDALLKGTSYSAEVFHLPPYSEGRITRIENTDYFVLELFAK